MFVTQLHGKTMCELELAFVFYRSAVTLMLVLCTFLKGCVAVSMPSDILV